MIHVLFIIAVEETQLLLPVGGVISGINIDNRDFLGGTPVVFIIDRIAAFSYFILWDSLRS